MPYDIHPHACLCVFGVRLVAQTYMQCPLQNVPAVLLNLFTKSCVGAPVLPSICVLLFARVRLYRNSTNLLVLVSGTDSWVRSVPFRSTQNDSTRLSLLIRLGAPSPLSRQRSKPDSFLTNRRIPCPPPRAFRVSPRTSCPRDSSVVLGS